MTFRELINKLLPGREREPTSAGAEPDKRSTKSTSKSSRSFSTVTTPSLAPSPPPYEEVAATTKATTSTSNKRSSHGKPIADILFESGNFSTKGKTVSFIYYLLVSYGLDQAKFWYKYEALPQYRAEGPLVAARAMSNAIGNYAFLLALLHCSKQYNISEGRLYLPVNEAVYTIGQHVKEQIVENLLQHGRYRNSKRVIEDLVDKMTQGTSGLDRALEYVDEGIYGGYRQRGNPEARDSIDTGELDVTKVQECWGLFKVFLAERTTSGDLLPPSGFDPRKNQSQAAMQGIWR